MTSIHSNEIIMSLKSLRSILSHSIYWLELGINGSPNSIYLIGVCKLDWVGYKVNISKLPKEHDQKEHEFLLIEFKKIKQHLD